jgi:hypothetical protein
MSRQTRKGFGLAFVTLLVSALILGGFTAQTAVASPNGYLPDRGVSDTMVFVAREATKESNCVWDIDGKQVPCAEGTVVLTFLVTESEAQARGESYVRPSKDAAATEKQVAELEQQVRASYPTLSANSLFLGDNPGTLSCTSNKTRGGSFTAFNFNGQPSISYNYTYNIIGSGCNQVQVTRVRGTVLSNPVGTTVNYDKSVYTNGFSGANQDDPGCPWGFPVDRGPNIVGPIGNEMVFTVENGCIFTPRASGKVVLN